MAKKALRKVQLNMRLPSPLVERLEKIGEPFGITRSELIRQAIVEFIQRNEGAPPPRPEQLRK